MRDLQLAAVSDDGRYLVLAGDGGRAYYRLPLDDALRAAIGGDPVPGGQLQIRLESSLSPRDIQGRFRAGETAESVARVAGVPIERVLRYEAPIRAERDAMARQAAKAVVADVTELYTDQSLGSIVAERLDGLVQRPPEWDAWRREDGLWVVQLTWVTTAGAWRSAQWTWDPVRLRLSSLDDAARNLVSGRISDDSSATSPAAATPPQPLSLVGRRQSGRRRAGRAGGDTGGDDDGAEGGSAQNGPMPDGPAEDGPLPDGPAEDRPMPDGPAEDAVGVGRDPDLRIGEPEGQPDSEPPTEPARDETDPGEREGTPAAGSSARHAVERTAEPTAVPTEEPLPKATGKPTGKLRARQVPASAPQPPAESPAGSAGDARPARKPATPAGRKGRRAAVPSWSDVLLNTSPDSPDSPEQPSPNRPDR